MPIVDDMVVFPTYFVCVLNDIAVPSKELPHVLSRDGLQIKVLYSPNLHKTIYMIVRMSHYVHINRSQYNLKTAMAYMKTEMAYMKTEMAYMNTVKQCLSDCDI